MVVTLKILVLAVHYEVTGARYITDALKRLKHEVYHVGAPARLADAWGVSVPGKYAWFSQIPPNDWLPDLVIIADTLTTHMDVPVLARNAPIVVWTQDNHVRNVRHAAIDHYFLAHYHGQSQPVSHPDETWLPCAADIHAFTPSPIPWDKREYDVCLVGVMYPQRVKLIDRLRAEGFKVFAATGLVYGEYQQSYANSRISLCVSANGDLAQRFFETAAIGCTVLTDLTDDLSNDPATNAELGLSGFAVYQNEDDCIHMVRDLLTVNPKTAAAGAKRLQLLVREFHTWEHRAQVVIDWYEQEYGGKVEAIEVKPTIEPKAFLNLGCGKTHFPSARPAGHEAIDEALYTYPLWVNVDKVEGVGADKVFDLFTYPWPLADNSFDGAVLAHIVEHIPHEIKTKRLSRGEWVEDHASYGSVMYKETENPNPIDSRIPILKTLQDGWYAFFSELYRVLTPGAVVHIISPYGWSDGGITDPTHTRYLTMNTFTHSMSPEVSDGSTFQYNNGGINFQIDGEPMYRVTPMFSHVKDMEELQQLMMTRLNVVYDFYVRLKAVK